MLPNRVVVSGLMALTLVLTSVGIWRAHRARLPPRGESILLEFRASSDFSPRQIRFEPDGVVRSARVGLRGWLSIERDDSVRALTVRIPGACPITLASRTGPGNEPRVIEVPPLFDLGPDRAQVGFDAPFEIAVRAGCAQGARGELSWRQVEGPELAELTVIQRGFRLRARTLPFSSVHPEPVLHGLVPIAPRTQGRYVLEAVWRDHGQPEVRRRVVVTSIARATGVPSIAVSQAVLLGGAGWQVHKAPLGGRAQVLATGALSSFAPDAQGRWQLEDAEHRELTISASTHDKTPLDCGRGECHAAIAEAALASPMSHALERHLTAEQQGSQADGCMLDCHVTGERGLHDGGFLDTAAALGIAGIERSRWQDLPQALRRLGGVRCMACHGPGAIPEPLARVRILSADVCATCHDAPPRYVHVSQWRSSPMSRADAQPRTASERACAACHTTAGFLDAIGARRLNDAQGSSEPAGIGCAACHAPHAAQRGAKLVRWVPVPSALGGPNDDELEPRTKVCLSCHAPVGQSQLPAASSAALWAGRVRLPSARASSAPWELVRGTSDHRHVPGGCIGCHGLRDEPAGRATEHSFTVNGAACAACHASKLPEERTDAAHGKLYEWALALERRLLADCALGITSASRPSHATEPPKACPSPALTRALYEVRLVLEDKAAFVHNAAFARSLLGEAETLLNTRRQHGAPR